MVRECPSCIESLVVPEDGADVGGKLPIPITTERLVLRRLGGGDWQDLKELLADEEMFRYAEGRPLEEEEILHWLESDGHVRFTSPGQPFYLGIQLRENEKLIGYLRSNFTDQQHLQVGITIFLNRSFQKKGFAREAVQAFLAFCFEGIGLHRVSVACDSRNDAACRLFEKLGLRREAEFVKDNLFNGEWANTIWFALLEEEYSEAKGASQEATN